MAKHRVILAINGSHRAENGLTEIALRRFLEGVGSTGSEYEVVYPAKMKIMHCDSCGKCLFETPGKCKFHDEMESFVTRMNAADGLVLACPVYFDCLPSMMQKLVERLRSTLSPTFEFRNGRTYHKPIHPKQHKAVTIFTAGNPEQETFVSISRVSNRIFNNMGGRVVAEFRFPASHFLTTQPALVASQLQALQTAGKEFAATGEIGANLLENANRAYFDDPEAVVRGKTQMIMEMRETHRAEKTAHSA